MASYSWPLLVAMIATSMTIVKPLTSDEKIERLEDNVGQLTRQLMLQQLFMEERIRSDGASGIKQVRGTKHGTQPYHATTATGPALASMHEHANNVRIVGLGEIIAVLNGVEFRTRHNDYLMSQSENITGSDSIIKYDTMREIPYPEVPPEVTAAGGVSAQAAEMREWFKAWKDQDYSERDYRKYFKPVLCYMEAGWTLSGDKIEEAFVSDRHSIDAASWFDLQEKIRFTAYSGHKDTNENYAYLPTTIMSTENGTTVLAQWNYRFACHPLADDLALDRFKLIDDIASRIAYNRSFKGHLNSRAARFKLAPDNTGEWEEKIVGYSLLDDLMGQIPGKDGYNCNLKDVGLDGYTSKNSRGGGDLNACLYHRFFNASKDAMGVMKESRGFADETLFMAKTTQPKIAPLHATKCLKSRKKRLCQKETQRWTFAIPFEVIYMTPLYQWNPYNVEYKGDSNSVSGKKVTANGRTGHSSSTAIDGNNNKLYYQTPVEFFSALEDSEDLADTSGKLRWVLDDKQVPRQMAASGTRIHLPTIKDVGRLRMRYPIMPFHYEGSAAWKELTALKDLILQPEVYEKMFYKKTATNTPGGTTPAGPN